MVNVKIVMNIRDNKMSKHVAQIHAKQCKNYLKKGHATTVKSILLYLKTRRNVSLQIVLIEKKFLRMENVHNVMIIKEPLITISNVKMLPVMLDIFF